MPPPAVAIIDIGSNSIKVLVAARSASGGLDALHSRSLDARISAGISATEPRLGEEGMQRGLAAIQELLASAAPFSPERAVLVATSAVRDAANGADFVRRIREATGFEIRILSGEEEALAIGRGLTSDPALRDLQNFYVFDLGGGSLECLSFEGRRLAQAASLQLGCVRLTEKFVADPSGPFPAAAASQVAVHTQAVITKAGFAFGLPYATAVVTGGTAATVRAIHAARTGKRAEETSSLVTARQVRDLLGQLAEMPLNARRQVPGLPAARADVFPTALATILAVADAGGFTSFRHSFHNLRYGLAAELLQSM